MGADSQCNGGVGLEMSPICNGGDSLDLSLLEKVCLLSCLDLNDMGRVLK